VVGEQVISARRRADQSTSRYFSSPTRPMSSEAPNNEQALILDAHAAVQQSTDLLVNRMSVQTEYFRNLLMNGLPAPADVSLRLRRIELLIIISTISIVAILGLEIFRAVLLR
jgi:hypothetical protein